MGQHEAAGRVDRLRSIMEYAIVIEQTPRNFSAYVPDLPGCAATGATRDEAVLEMRTAIAFHNRKPARAQRADAFSKVYDRSGRRGDDRLTSPGDVPSSTPPGRSRLALRNVNRSPARTDSVLWRTRPLADLSENFDAIRVPVKESDRQLGPLPVLRGVRRRRPCRSVPL